MLLLSISTVFIANTKPLLNSINTLLPSAISMVLFVIFITSSDQFVPRL
uniref:Uncharacterized protein n=1 Tax=Cryptosporidium parvum TaxID=5807 RepID=F0X5B9_CRYPV